MVVESLSSNFSIVINALHGYLVDKPIYSRMVNFFKNIASLPPLYHADNIGIFYG